MVVGVEPPFLAVVGVERPAGAVVAVGPGAPWTGTSTPPTSVVVVALWRSFPSDATCWRLGLLEPLDSRRAAMATTAAATEPMRMTGRGRRRACTATAGRRVGGGS